MTTEAPIIVGLDPGNSEATAVCAPSGKPQIVTIPAEIGAGQLRDLQRIRGGAGAAGRLALGEYVLEHDGAEWFVGALALEQSADAQSARGDVTRYWSGHTLRLLLVLLGALIREPECRVRIVTGLPISVWDAAVTVPRVQRALCGTHAFRLNDRARVLHVEGALVVMEGAGALAAHGSADDLPQAVIDIGGRTTNLYWAQGQRPLLPRCSGLARGVGDVADALADGFLAEYGRELSLAERRTLLWAHAQRAAQPPIFVDGRPVVMGDAVAQAIGRVGGEIRSQVSRRWRSSEQGAVAAEAARVLCIGGGAYYFAASLKPFIPALSVPARPELANAQGYLAIGSQLSERAWARLKP